MVGQWQRWQVGGGRGERRAEPPAGTRHVSRRPRAVALLVAAVLAAQVAVVTSQPPRPAGAAEVFVVTSSLDAVDVSPGDGICASGSGACTLRAAIQEANAVSGADVIRLPAGTYELTSIGAAEDLAATGDLDISGPVEIVGAGTATTVIDGGGHDRVLHVLETAGGVTLSGLTVQGGETVEDGAGINSQSDGALTLTAVTVTANTTTASGGGIHTAGGTLHLTGVTISGNRAATGGGVDSSGEPTPTGLASSLVIGDSSIVENEATDGDGGGIASGGEGSLTLDTVTIADNVASGSGGGASVTGRSALTVTGGTFSDNQAHGEGGGLSVESGRAARITGTAFTGNDAGVPTAAEAGEAGGGALLSGGDGTLEISGASFTGNSASSEGGALLLGNRGSVTVSGSTLEGNEAGAGGGAIENTGSRVTLSGLTITGNRAQADGGGIESNGSGAFTVIDTTLSNNTAENGGGFANAADGTTRVERSLFWGNRALVGTNDDSGLGGGIYSLGDAAASYENVTITGNYAQVRGGGFYVDADAGVRVTSSTIAGNSAPVASGAGGEETVPTVPAQPSTSVIFRNTIVAGNLLGPNCSFPIGSEGGNLQGDSSCHFAGLRDRTVADPGVDAVANNGGPTMTMAIQPGSLALDGGVGPCPLTDQRGVSRPQNGVCDSGAFESQGPFPPPDALPPDTDYLSGPFQDTEATSAFTFSGTDNTTPGELLAFECRLLVTEVGEPPEPPDPTAPPDPELAWLGCSSPWQVPLIEDGLYRFEVRAIDRAGNIDPTPAVHTFNAAPDVIPPDTFFLETPPNPSTSSSATFTVGGTDDQTPPAFLEIECRIDTLDPEAWLECTNPAVYSNLTLGTHTVEARATDGGDNVDPTPARFTWEVLPPADCDLANITLGAEADVYVDQTSPQENHVVDPALVVRSGDLGTNARALIRFPVTSTAPGCELQTAVLRLYAGSGEPGRVLEAVPLTDAWQDSTATWLDQPAAGGAPVAATSGAGYRQWDVTAEVSAILAGDAPNHGWVVRDSVEDDPAGAEQGFHSRETPQDPPSVTVPQLILRYDASGIPAPPPPGPGAPATLECGDVVTESVVLQNDVVGCFGEGLVVGAPDIEIDLNGHTVASGLVAVPGEEDGLLAGIRNAGHANVVIRNGTVEGFGYGVRLMAGARFNLVESLTLERNVVAGVELLDADDGRNGNTVRNNTFTGNGDGVALVGGTEAALVTANTFGGNVGRAIYLLDASGNRIESNTVSGLTADPTLGSDGGIALDSSPDNVIVGNTLSDAGDAGVILTAGSHRTRIEGNTIFRTSDSSIGVDGSEGVSVVGNTVHQAGGAAISFGDSPGGTITGNDARFNPTGVELSGSDGLLVADNDASFSQADGIVVEGGLGITIRDNRASSTGGAGLAVEVDAFDPAGNPIPGNLIQGNIANNNLANGISVGGGGHRVGGNQAFGNAAFGITAGDGVIDDGGNTGAGNGEPVQCVNVVCGPGSGGPPPAPDLTAPDTELLTTPAPGASTFESHTFVFTGSDNTAPATALRFECRLDAPPDPPTGPPDPPDPGEPPDPVEPPPSDTWRQCGSPTTYELLPAGTHTFEVRATDPFDNVDLTPATFVWTVVAGPPGPDATAPTTFIIEGPVSPHASSSATISFSGSDNATPGPNLGFECALDGAAYTPCTSPTTVNGLAVGDHSLAVRAIDLQGNTDASPAVHSWTVVEPAPDATAPETSIESGPDATTVATIAAFTFSSDEANASFLCAVDGGPSEPCLAPFELDGLAVGGHTFRVTARDAAGNLDPTPAEWTWTITPAPVPGAVTCGQTVTTSIRLLNDLTNCPGDGLVVGADGITIDLDGHSIDGTNLGSGVANRGHDSVTVTNGSISEFDLGVELGNGTALAIVSDLTLQANQIAGIQLTNADNGIAGNTLRRNLVVGNTAGILVLGGTQRAVLTDNTLAGSATVGISVQSSSGNTLDGNRVSGTSGPGIELDGASTNTVRGNVVDGSSGPAIDVHTGSSANSVTGNDLADSESGIVVDSSDGNRVADNTVHGMSGAGVALGTAADNQVIGNDLRFNGTGVDLEASTGNTIEANNASETSGTGIEVGTGSTSNRLIANTASANDVGGISVGTAAAPGLGNLLQGNTANDNTGDGIWIGDVGHMVTGNTANNNLEWGIYAADATVAGQNLDGGGNRAQGNTGGEVDPVTLQPLQCKNIVCDGGPPQVSDTVAPTTSIASAPVDPSVLRTATFRFSGTDNASPVTFQCRLDSTDPADFEPCTSPRPYTGLTLGAHRFEVRAIDFSGNVDLTPATHLWTIEVAPGGVAPDTTIDTHPDSSTVSPSALFTFSSNEPDVSYECSVDEAAFTACASPAALADLAVGMHRFEVRAVDSESLVDPTPASFVWTVGAPPAPGAVSCGQLVTASIRVTNDLTDCAGNGLVVGANGITIDLDGHTLDGTGLGAGVVNDGFDGVTVTDGVIQEFDFGVQFGDGAAGGFVTDLTVQRNQEAGIQLIDADSATAGTVVRANTVTDNRHGIWLTSGTQLAVVVDNTVSANAGDGIVLESSSGNRLEGNEVSGSSGAGVALIGAGSNTIIDNTVTASGGPGVAVGEVGFAADGNRIEANTITANSGPGVAVMASAGTEVIANRVTGGSSSGVELDQATDSLVQANELTANAGAIEIVASTGNRIEANNASGSNGSGISLEAGSLSNTVVLNNVSGNSGDGITVDGETTPDAGNRIDRNIAASNSGNGIIVNGAGHTVGDNTVTFNDGWGILASPGTIDGGGNTAAGNAEPTQCSGVVCAVTAAPGAPDTEIIDRPTDPSNNRNALFTFVGTDDTTPLANLGFECRLDSTDPLAWVECDNPQEYLALVPGLHTFEVRAVDQTGLVDPTPASYAWTYDALPLGLPPDTFIDLAPPLASPLLEGVFTFSSNEPDADFECSLDGSPFEPCAFAFAFEFAFEETEVGSHTFQVRAIDFELLVDPTPATYTWTVTGITTTVTDGPAFIPPEGPGEPASGGETAIGSATLTFEANVSDATFLCSLDLGPFVPCAPPITYAGLPVGEHIFQVLATDPESEATQLEATVYEWTVIPGEDTVAPQTTIVTAPGSGTGDTVFTFAGTDNVTPSPAITFECRLDSSDAAGWFDCASPFNLLSQFPDLPPGPHVFEVRANDNAEPADPSSPVEGNVDPTPAIHSWTMAADTVGPETALLAAPTGPTTDTGVAIAFTGTDGATPADLLTFECSIDGSPFEPCASPHTIQGLTPGEHTVSVRAVDLALNPDPSPATATWIQVGAPVTSIIDGPTNPSPSQDATFTFAADQPGVGFTCSLDGAAPSPCTSPFTVVGLVDGEHVLEIQATNGFGLSEIDPLAVTWTVAAGPDLVAPITTLTATPAGVALDGTAQFEFTANEFGATFRCTLDGAEPQVCSSPRQESGLGDGAHTFTVTAVDAAGNPDPTPATFTWIVDLAPLAEIVSGPSSVTEATDATFILAANETVAGFECYLDGVTEPCASPVTYTGLGVGAHTFAVRAVDDTASSPAPFENHEWEIVAAAAPSTAFGDVPPPLTTETMATFTFTGADNLTGPDALVFECSLDGAAFAPCSSPLELTGLADGVHRLEVRSIDQGGTADPTPAVATWTVQLPDTEPPVTSLVSGPPATGTATSATFLFSASEAGASFGCSLDGATFDPCTSPLTLTGLTTGAHTLVIRATDGVGNVETAPLQVDWTVEADTAAPDTEITGGPAGTILASEAMFTFAGSDNVTAPGDLAFECSLDGAPFEPCTSPELVPALAVGHHTFAVRATDGASLVDPSPAERSFTVADSAAPDTSIGTGPASPTEATTASLTFTADEAGATFECSLDGASFAPCTSPVSLGGLTVGEHGFRVRARDAAGNADPTPAEHRWTVVAPTPPDTSILSGPPASTSSTIATFTFGASEPGTTFQCALDAGPFNECETPHEVANLAIGAHQLAVRAVDAADTPDPTPATYTWTVTAPPPPPASCNTSATTYSSAADSWIDQGAPSNGNGSDSNLKVMSKAGANLRALVRFNLPASLPSGCVVESATLRLFASSSSPGRSLRVAGAASAWAESTVNWTNQPAPSGSAVTAPSGAGWVQWNVTDLVQASFASGANHGFVVRDSVEGQDNEQQFSSREQSGNRPQLVVTYATAGAGSSTTTTTAPTTTTTVATTTTTTPTTSSTTTTSPPSSTTTVVSTTTTAAPTTTVACPAAVTLTPRADAFIEQASPGQNKGQDADLKVKASGPSSSLRSLVAFTMPDLPAGCVVQTATLRLFAGSSAGGRTLRAVRLGAAWTEGAVTWSNQPATVGSVATTASGNNYREWNVVSQVRDGYGAGAHHGFLIRDANENGSGAEQTFHSREKGQNPPQLVLTFAPGT